MEKREIVQMIPPWSSGVNTENRLPVGEGTKTEDIFSMKDLTRSRE